MAKAKMKPKANEAAKPKAKPVAKAPSPLAKAMKPPSSNGKVEKSKPKTAVIERKATASKPASGRIEKPAAGKATKKPATGKIEKPQASVALKAKSKPERVERPSKIPVVNRADLTGLTSPFDRREIKEWRVVLISKRNEITDDIAGLVKDAMEAEDGHTTPNHIAERGSDADLQEFSLGMAGEEKVELWLIDRALRKIDELLPVPFGLCEYTKKPIQKSRLDLLPWTPLSIDGAQYMEENSLTLEDMLIDD